ncbi:MAG: amino acid racemase [Agathobacter sp.]|uniref:aspartate/glutamate racemase family protein n=1 Tax=Agathobacter sp. TaxID=2021311 RepID=UPI002586D269|nr:amino acid racemase [Agathobacter sp.]MCR5677375.1 amino acid racemase [Agathobacter sp.]
MNKLGVIGGLGPMATAYFYQLVVQMTDAATDQEHIETIIYSRPSTPDRTKFILGKSNEDPMPFLLDAGRKLKRQGANVIAIPCITAHYFQKRLEKTLGTRVIHAIEETGKYLKANGITVVGIMATDGTVESRLFQTILEKYGIACVIPSEKNQAKVMHIIYDDVKSGRPVEMDLFEEVSDKLFAQGAQTVLLGCTELSLIKRDYQIGKGFLDVMEVLARQAVIACGKLKEEYNNLITE